MKKYVVYKATNKINMKGYIGKTTTGIDNRIKRHLKSVKSGSNNYFHNALRKYGNENFDWEILYEGTTDTELKEKEIYFIEKHKTFYKNNGYNMTFGGDGGPVFYGDDNTSKRFDVREKLHQKTMNQLKNGSHPSQNAVSLEKMSLSHMGLHVKKYEIITPDNEKLMIINMNKFCKENNLCSANMYMTANGQQSNHKGYLCKKIDD
jgi:group I intron endonuclease